MCVIKTDVGSYAFPDMKGFLMRPSISMSTGIEDKD